MPTNAFNLLVNSINYTASAFMSYLIHELYPFLSVKRIAHPAYELDVQPSQGIRPSSTLDDNVSNGGPKSKKEEK